MDKKSAGILLLMVTILVVAISWLTSGFPDSPSIDKAAVVEGTDSTPEASSTNVADHEERATGSRTPSKMLNRAAGDEIARIDGLNLANNLQALAEEAKTNPRLAYALSMAILQCSIADRAYAGMSEQVRTAQSAKTAEKQLSDMERVYRKCDGLKGDHLELQFDLAGQAGQAGVLEAMKNYRMLAAGFVVSEAALRRPTASVEFANNVKSFTARAAETGDPDALYNAYALYSDGVIVKPDPVLAYRYLSRFNRARSTGFGPSALSELGSKLTPEQLRAATQAR